MTALGGQAFDLLERHGGRNCRLWQQQANGFQPDALVATIEFDNMAAYGKRSIHSCRIPELSPSSS